MTIIILIFLCISFFSIRKTDAGGYKYLSKEVTDTVKGFFLYFVFVRHFIQYNPPFSESVFNNIGYIINKISGQLIVTMFLFYSGYGVMEAAKSKGKKYTDTFLKKRVLKTWFNFDIAVCFYILITAILGAENITLKKTIMSLIGLESFGNSNWYIFCILVMYLISFAALKISGANNKGVLLTFFGTTAYIIILYILGFDSYWFNSAYCYLLGCFWSINKEKIEDFLMIYDKKIMLIDFVLFMLTYLLSYKKVMFNEFFYCIACVLFCLMFVFVTRYIHFENRILMYGGMLLFPLFIYQRIPMILFKKINWIFGRPYFYFIICMIFTIMLALIYQFLHSKNKKYIKKEGVLL